MVKEDEPTEPLSRSELTPDVVSRQAPRGEGMPVTSSVESGSGPVVLRIEPRQMPAASDSDTLLSAPAPAQHLELMLEDRLGEFDQRLELLAARVSVLERRRSVNPAAEKHRSWLWIAFLFGLAILWKILTYFQ